MDFTSARQTLTTQADGSFLPMLSALLREIMGICRIGSVPIGMESIIRHMKML